MPDLLAELTNQYRYPGQPGWVMPAYAGRSTVNLMNSFLACFGARHDAPLAFHDDFMAALHGARKILFIVFDGMGWMNIERVHGQRPIVREMLQAARRWPLTTVFPSTTSTAISTLGTGVPPALHGVIGYLMYFPEYRHVFNMLSFTTPDTSHLDLLSFGFTPESYLEHPTIFHRLRRQQLMVGTYTYHAYVSSGLSRMVYHDTVPHPYYALGDMLSQSMEQLRSPLPQFLFLYWYTLDTLAHNYGAGSEAYADELAMLLTVIHTQVLPKLDAETALVITADHGHIDGNDADSYNLMDLPEVVSLLRTVPAGEGRAMHLFIQEGQVDRVRELLSRLSEVTILSKDELLAQHLYGDVPIRPGLDQHIGDLLLLPHGSRRILYEYQRRPHTAMMGRHGGLAFDEMLVPLLVYTRRG